MTKMMLAGDWHGDREWGPAMVALAAQLGYKEIFHVGDFGVWPGSHGRLFRYRPRLPGAWRHDLRDSR